MSTLFLLALIFEGLFGVGFVLAPAAVLAPLGLTLDDTATALARLFGSALIGFPVLLWFARKSNSPEFKRAAVYALFAYYLVSTVVLVITQMGGLMNALGWSVVAMHVAFTVSFGYFIVKK
jgi:hypothetical protein